MATVEAIKAYEADIENYARGAVRHFSLALTEGLTVGRGRSRGVPVDTGEAFGSLRMTVHHASRDQSRRPYRHLHDGRVKAVIRRWRLGQTLWWKYVADHVKYIAPGRRMGSRGMIGSLQAPNGWVLQSIDEATASLRNFRRIPRSRP